jgi:PHD/YefM family antitoxin component YafN of YafNO toxin-antitoxin module
MTEPLRYVTNEDGQPVAVLLDLDEYRRLQNQPAPDPDLLTGLSSAELQALSESTLAPAQQDRLNELLARNNQQQLSAEETAELDRLLDQVDQLTILKTRARLTLSQQKDQSAATALLPLAANAHAGHIAAAAGHDHWLAGAALGAAVAVTAWAVLSGRKDKEKAAAEPETESEETDTEAESA